MKKFILFISFLIISLFLISSCDQEVSVTPEDQPLKITKIFIQTNPEGAQIFLDGRNSNYTTPDSVPFFENKNYTVLLKKEYFRDTILIANPFKLIEKSIIVNYLDNSTMYGRIRCYTNPQGAKVYLEDSLTSIITPDTLRQIIPGIRKIKFKKDGYLLDSVFVEVYSNFTSDAIKTLSDSTSGL